MVKKVVTVVLSLWPGGRELEDLISPPPPCIYPLTTKVAWMIVKRKFNFQEC